MVAGVAAACVSGCPGSAEVFAQGGIDFRLMAAVVYRTELIEDPELTRSHGAAGRPRGRGCCPVNARLDAAVARHAPKWMRFVGAENGRAY